MWSVLKFWTVRQVNFGLFPRGCTIRNQAPSVVPEHLNYHYQNWRPQNVYVISLSDIRTLKKIMIKDKSVFKKNDWLGMFYKSSLPLHKHGIRTQQKPEANMPIAHKWEEGWHPPTPHSTLQHIRLEGWLPFPSESSGITSPGSLLQGSRQVAGAECGTVLVPLG